MIPLSHNFLFPLENIFQSYSYFFQVFLQLSIALSNARIRFSGSLDVLSYTVP